MRKRFEQQTVIGRLLIEDTVIPTKKRSGALPALFAALKALYLNPEWNEKIFLILEQTIFSKNNNTGRTGMDLWQIFILAQVRLCQNICYDELHDLANHHTLVRQMMGVEGEFGTERQVFSYQSIIDNVSMLNDETVEELNTIIVGFGHDVLKKKEEEALSLKTDSFVVESNVHFPTDYNLLWDSARKCLDMVIKLQENHKIPGWRKIHNWLCDLKNKMRSLGRASASGGKAKQSRLLETTQQYLVKAKALYQKLEDSKADFKGLKDSADMVIISELYHFMTLLSKHINLLERRVIEGEKIDHSEKMFSIFEDYTEWITKGKMRPSVELGKKLNITTDQFNLIVDYQIMENQSDSQIVPELAQRIFSKHKVKSWSFDKGYWNKENKALLCEKVDILVMPKKGKCNKEEYEEEHRAVFKKIRHKHSAVESNINELENRGLDRCPDRGYDHFKRYIGLGVCAYNLRKIGAYLITVERESNKKSKVTQAA